MHTIISSQGQKDTEQGVRDYFTTVCKDVCEPCNTGWLHELEESARPILSPLIAGENRAERYWRQNLGATWAMKTVLVWDSVAPQYRIIPRVVANHFYRTQSLIPMRQQVWLGRYSGDQPQHSFRQVAAFAESAPPEASDSQDAHAHLSMVSIGQLAYVVFGHILPQPWMHSLPPALGDKLVQIWPPQTDVVRWPAETLSDADASSALMSLDTSGASLVRPRPR